jgi:tripartite-type tricarboxylate transporter receptor subunit TctC
MHLILSLALLAAGWLAVGTPAYAEYPDRPIKMVVPLAPGGGTDITARTVATAISADWNTTIAVENKTGGGTSIASLAVATAPADGYTVYVNTASFLISARTIPNLRYDAHNDFTPVSLLASSDHILVVSPRVPVKTFAEFRDWVRAKNGAATFASFGAGSSSHLGFELFLHRAGLNMVHVPYKGNAPAMTDLLGGHVDAMFADHVDDALKASGLPMLAVMGPKRLPEIPDVPTLQELGVKDFTSSSFYGLMVRKGTPDAIVEKWSAAAHKALQTKTVRDTLQLQGIVPAGTTPKEYAAFLKKEDAKYAETLRLPSVAAGLGLKP